MKAEEEQRTTVVIEPEMTANASNASPVGQYQPLTAEEELRTTVVVEPEESAGYIVVTPLAFLLVLMYLK